MLNTENANAPDNRREDDGGRAQQRLVADARTFVTFDLSGQTLGVEVSNVREILDKVEIKRIPNASSRIEGIVDIRGESIPIIDIRSQLGMHDSSDEKDNRIIVFEVSNRNDPQPVGIIADRVRDVTQIFSDQIEKPSDLIANNDYEGDMLGLARHDDFLIFLLDIKSLLQIDFDCGEMRL
ncbi:MAG: chemotaxis protein CheW [Pseudomonadota bacterium]